MKLAVGKGHEAVCMLCPDDEVVFKDKDPVALERRVREHLRLEHHRVLVSVSECRGQMLYEGPRVGREVFDG